MKMANVARWADTTELYDAYHPLKFVMRAQISSYMDNQSNGTVSTRRVVSYAPNLTLPERKAVTFSGENWIAGDGLKDFWKGKPIRVSVAIRRANNLARVSTPAEACQGDGLLVLCQSLYLKDTIDPVTTSAYSPQFQVFFATNEDMQTGYIIFTQDSRWLHVRSTYPVIDGFICAEADELTDAYGFVLLHSVGDYDPATDSKPDTVTSMNVIVLDYNKLYGKESALAAGQSPGDLTFLSDTEPKVGDWYEYQGAHWNILGVNSYVDAYRVHVRRV